MASRKARKQARPKPRPAKGKPRRPPGSRPKPKARPPRPSPNESSPESAFPATVPPRDPDERQHVLSLSFVRDGDEFLARLETDSGQITELKNRSLDQLLMLVASELEDQLE